MLRSLSAVTLVAAVIVVATGTGFFLKDLRIGRTIGVGPPLADEPALVYLDGPRSRFIVAKLDGLGAREQDVGGTIHSYAVDPSGAHIAAWRANDRDEYELVVWRVGGSMTVLLGPTVEFPNGRPVWDSRSSEIAVSLVSLPPPQNRTPTGSPVSSRILVAPVRGGQPIQVVAFGTDSAPVPVAITNTRVVAFKGDHFVAFRRVDGVSIEDARIQGLTSYGADARAGLAFAIVTGGDALSPRQSLSVWPVDGPYTAARTTDSPTFNAPVVWPGRSEVVFGTGSSLRAFDTTIGVARDLTNEDTIVMPEAFSPDGDFLVAKRLLAPFLKLYETHGDRVVTTAVNIALPPGAVHLVGFARTR